MNTKLSLACIAAFALFNSAISDEQAAQQEAKHTEKQIAPGVVLETISNPAGPWEARLVKISKGAMKDYEFKISEANDACPGLESTLDAYIAMSAKERGRLRDMLLSHDLRNGRKRVMNLINAI